MPKYRVPVKVVTRILYEFEATNKEEAMNRAIEMYDIGDGEFEVETSEGDPEVYYPDIRDVNVARPPVHSFFDSILDPRD